MLDYWVDLMDFDEPVPEWVKRRELTGAVFHGPSETVALRSTRMESSYPNFGFTFDRARFDDWLTERAREAGADLRVGSAVRSVEPRRVDGGWEHELTLRNGEGLVAEYLILADGPQRTVTGQLLERFLPEAAADRLSAPRANHIAYQEHRRFPEELFDADTLQFWWGAMPGHTAYPWVFPNDDTVARVGLTMPIALDLEAVPDRSGYSLLRPEDERVPPGKVYVERLLEQEYPGYDLADFPLVEDRGKQGGTETYPISSTRPIDSPTRANVAVVGGAMGTTSAFHEGGDHTAVRSGKIAGRLAGLGALRAYNSEWKHAIGDEVLRNVVFAEMVRGYGPGDWDDLFGLINRIMEDGGFQPADAVGAGLEGLRYFADYRRRKFGYRDGGYVQITENEYAV
jgi:electron-transferring-flavoprotein dehydrogenase